MSILESQGFLKISKRRGQKYGFTIVYDNVQPSEQNGQPAERYGQPAEQNNNNNTKDRYKRATQIPDNFKPTETMLVYLREKRPDIDPETFTENFIISCKAKGYLYKRWDMAWQKWVNNEVKHNDRTKKNKGRSKRPDLKDINDSFSAAAEMAFTGFDGNET